MNLPNQLTVARMGLTIVFVAVLSSQWRFGNTAALIIFVVAGITDYFDGAIARERNLVTDFGKLMDPLADKVMMAAAFILLIPEGAYPAWVAVVIISRELAITGLRLLAANKGQLLPSENLGKHKTAWQIITISYFLVLLAWKELGHAGYLPSGLWWFAAWFWGGRLLVIVVLALTVYSGVGYLWRNRAVIDPA